MTSQLVILSSLFSSFCFLLVYLAFACLFNFCWIVRRLLFLLSIVFFEGGLACLFIHSLGFACFLFSFLFSLFFLPGFLFSFLVCSFLLVCFLFYSSRSSPVEIWKPACVPTTPWSTSAHYIRWERKRHRCSTQQSSFPRFLLHGGSRQSTIEDCKEAGKWRSGGATQSTAGVSVRNPSGDQVTYPSSLSRNCSAVVVCRW
jgi:hypothetical protein